MSLNMPPWRCKHCAELHPGSFRGCPITLQQRADAEDLPAHVAVPAARELCACLHAHQPGERDALGLTGLRKCAESIVAALEGLAPAALDASALQLLDALWVCVWTAHEFCRVHLQAAGSAANAGAEGWRLTDSPTQTAAQVEEHTNNLWHALGKVTDALNLPSCPAPSATAVSFGTWQIPPIDGDTWGHPEAQRPRLDVAKNRRHKPTTVLGSGGFGIVALGIYTDENNETREVAVKMALDNVLEFAKQPEHRKILLQYEKEVELLCKLVHPNICACYGAITYAIDKDLCMWIVMEKLGMDLHKVIASQSLPLGRDDPRQFTSIVQGVVSALAYVHSLPKPLVHRDVKPHNIMLSLDNVPKLVDFGLAKETLVGAGSTHNFKGTEEWMAPEQLQKGGGCSTASDMYAAGLVARFLWSGQTPSKQQSGMSGFECEGGDDVAAYTLQLMHACIDKVFTPAHIRIASHDTHPHDTLHVPAAQHAPHLQMRSKQMRSVGS